MKKILLSFVIVLLSFSAIAQENAHYELDKLTTSDLFTLLKYNSMNAKLDTSYIGLPAKSWMVSLGNLGEFTSIGVVQSVDEDSRLVTYSGLSDKIRVGLFYRGLGLNLGYSLRKTINSNFSIGTDGNAFGINLTYQKNKQSVNDVAVNLHLADISAYYVLNSKKYSINAVTKHSYIQKKSAGSAFITADITNALLRTDLVDFFSGDGSGIVYQLRTALGVGYGYNLVFDRGKFVIHGSFAPNVNFFSMTKEMDIPTISWIDREKSYRMTYGHNAKVGAFYDMNYRFVVGFLATDRYSHSSPDIIRSFSYNYWGVEVYTKYRF